MLSFVISVIILIGEQVKENGGMATCSASLGYPPKLGKIDFDLDNQTVPPDVQYQHKKIPSEMEVAPRYNC